MTSIDWDQIITAEDDAETKRIIMREGAKAACHKRLETAASQNTQINLAAGAAAGILTADEMQYYRDWLTWNAAMRATWRVMPADADLCDDANWPILPKAVSEVLARF